MTLASINPATGETLAEFSELTHAELESRLVRAADAAARWRFTPVGERAAVVARLGALLDEDKERLGRIMTLEMGKPIRAAVEEAAKCAMACRYYAEHGPASSPIIRSQMPTINRSWRTSHSASCWR